MSASACSREVTLKAPARFARPVRLSADMGHSGDVLQVGGGTLANEARPGTGWDRTPGRATQRAAWEAFRQPETS
jgi:hypothetical protein